MITPASIPYVTRLLAEPQHLTETDATPVGELVQMYPYFVPARYMEAALMQGSQGHTPASAIHTRLYAGNWVLHQEYVQAAAGHGSYSPLPAQEAAPAYNDGDSYSAADTAFVNTYAQEKAPAAEAETTWEAPAEEETRIAQEVETATGKEIDEDEIDIFGEEPPALEDELNDSYEIVEERAAPPPAEGPFAAPRRPTAPPPPAATAAEAAPVVDDETLILPLYTEDYFLHQGLQVANELPAEAEKKTAPAEADTDQSLMVVMSFSDWLLHFKNKGERQKEEVEDKKALRSMWQKEKLAAAMEEENEEIPESVFEMAVNSIAREEDLASEPLAEIHLMQGKYDAAMEMYKKLSLRNPQKSAYFARKIEAILKEKHS